MFLALATCIAKSRTDVPSPCRKGVLRLSQLCQDGQSRIRVELS